MVHETLEEKLDKSSTKSNIWDFLVTAYSSNKSIKIGLTLLGQGYSYIVTTFAAGVFYFGTKTAGKAIKYAIELLVHPINYLKNFNLKEKISEAIEFYNPFGKYKRPTFMGGILSAVTYFTGF